MKARSGVIKEEPDYVNAARARPGAGAGAGAGAGTTVDESAATSGKKFQLVPPLAACWVTLLLIVSVRIYFTSVMAENNAKLTAQNQELETQNQNLTVQNQKLETQNQKLTVQNQKLGTQNQKLETQNRNLTAQNQRLETERNNLTERIQDMETKWNELNISRAQWSVDAYCPTNKNRRCGPCRPGWLDFQSDCFASKNVKPAQRRSWDGARADCKEESSDLVVIDNDNEKEFVSRNSYGSLGTTGFWIGLRVKDGKWKWVDGRDLAETSWMDQPATEGQCAISVQDEGWKSVNCGETQQWICEQKGLTI